VEKGGKKIRLQTGVIGARANQLLVPYGAKIGPDPASIATCTIGGIFSNNSSGMCCGVEQKRLSHAFVDDLSVAFGHCDRHRATRCRRAIACVGGRTGAGILNLKVKLEADTALRERVRSRLKPDTLRAATAAAAPARSV
jgi:D-lactate dehydrogenase